MAEVVKLAELARRHWLSQGLRVSALSPEQVRELRKAFPIGLSSAYLEFIQNAGLPSDEDRKGFRFWPPPEVRLTHDVLKDAGYCIDAVDTSHCSIVVADYLHESWWYSLWLTGPFEGGVSLVLGQDNADEPHAPFGTFEEFIIHYMRDDAILYPKGS